MAKLRVLWFTNTPCGADEILSPNLNRGGWLKSLEQFLSSVDGIELHVCFYFNRKIQDFKYNNVNYHVVARKTQKNKLSRYVSRILRINNDEEELGILLEYIKKVCPDIIHVHGTEENFGLLSQHDLGIPLVISIQGVLNAISEKYFSGISRIASLLNQPLISWVLFNSAKHVYRDLEQRSVREKIILLNSKGIIGRTAWDERVMRILAPNAKYFKNNEVLRKEFYSRSFNSSKCVDELHIVSTITSGHFKGLETLIRTYILLRNTVDFRISWKIIGLKEKSDYSKMIANYLGVKLNSMGIEFLGYQSADQVVNILCDADVYCQVSHMENSPNSLCEAMLVGLPAVASYAGGTSTILKEGVEGILFQTGDHYALAGALIETHENYEKSLLMASKARERALARHDPSEVSTKLISIYDEIIAAKI